MLIFPLLAGHFNILVVALGLDDCLSLDALINGVCLSCTTGTSANKQTIKTNQSFLVFLSNLLVQIENSPQFEVQFG